MVRRVTPAQFRSMVRQAQTKQKQAIDKYNREVQAHNRKVKATINKYNQEVNRYNARVRANQHRLRRELNKLAQAASQTRYVTFRMSVESVQRSYIRLESNAEASRYDDRYNEVLDLSEQEAANNASVMNALLGNPEDLEHLEAIHSSKLDYILSPVSGDLRDRWHGALFSLNPWNPDAGRHFCTSARELLTLILDSRAPDKLVLRDMPECEKTPNGTPTRRSKIRYLLRLKHMADETLEDFVEEDMNNVVQLFQEFNDGTHGSSGHFTHQQLVVIKKRVEDAVAFLWSTIPEDLRQAV